MTGVDQALAETALDLLRADTELTVHDGDVPTDQRQPPYVLVYVDVNRGPFDQAANQLCGESGRVVANWTCHCVGRTAEAARAVAQRVSTALLDVRPVVAGLTSAPIRQAEALPPQKDETTGDRVMDAVLTYTVTAWS